MFQPNQRVTVDLSGLVIQGVSFSQNVQKALGTILQQVSTDPPVYKVELLSSAVASAANTSRSATTPCACTHASRLARVAVIPAISGVSA